MARIRSDKPEAYQSETLAEISVAAERTFKGMATIADDRGRMADKPAQINGELWSMRGSHTKDDLEAELAEMVKADLVCRYAGCDGKRYLHFVTWDKHQKIDRPSKSRLPRCPHHREADEERDYCGIHKGECVPFADPSRQSREDSRDLQPGETGHDGDHRDLARDGRDELEGGTGDDPGTGARTGTEQGEQKSSRQSREPSMLDLGPRTVDLGSVPPTAGAAKARRRLPPKEAAERQRHVGDVVAAFVDGAREAGLSDPGPGLRSRVGKQARDLLGVDWPIDFLIDSARRMGAGKFNDLEIQVRKDEAEARGVGEKPPGQQATDGLFERAAARMAAREISP